MIPGFNHNVNYHGQVFHIQTEDSGIGNPHVITHLFVGGNIVDTRKMSYADIVKSDRLEEVIVELMQDQHKQMLKDLVSGQFDHKIGSRSQGASMLNGPAPLNVDRGQDRSSVMLPGTGRQAERVPAAPAAMPPTAPKPAPKPAPAPMAPVPEPVPTPAARPIPRIAPPPIQVDPPPRVVASDPIPSSVFDLPSAPARAPEPEAEENVISADSLQKAFDSDNKEAINSIFGEDLISEKSLDEVILGYLAEDVHG